jgi:hypothetical protein
MLCRTVAGVAVILAQVALAFPADAISNRQGIGPERASGKRQCLLFKDSFGQPSLQSWFSATGAWSVEDGRLVGTGWGGGIDGWIYVLPSPRASGPLTIDVDVELLNGNAEIVLNSTGHWRNEYRVTVWWSESPDYPNSYQIARYRNYELTQLTNDNVPTAVPIPHQAHLTVTRAGDVISLYVNGELVDAITDPDPLPGGGAFGLGVTWNYTVSFDNFVVRAGRCGAKKGWS